MKFTIHKNRHRAWPWQLGLWHKKYAIRKRITFGYGCNYFLPGEDGADTNKLFGIGFLWNHHFNSARFGWLHVGDNKIQINAYIYDKGKRTIEKLCDVPVGFVFEYHLIINPNFIPGYYTFRVKNPNTGMILAERDFPFKHQQQWGFPLGLFFGGNKPAPQKMIIEMKNL